MALRKRGVAQAFRNNPQLRQFVLTDVTPTGKILGTGSYGSVEEVKYQHLVCAGKKIHEALIEEGNEGVTELVQKYEQECQLMSSLRHPNITLFLGLCFLPETQLPLLVMEQLETSLDDLLEHMPGLPLSLKHSVLEDVASGLVYLHKRTPPVIHRDLTAKNILLTSSLVAKITDMGNSRIVNIRPGQMARTLSKAPGTLVYMPPEALGETHRYGPSLDIFSFGHLALYTIIQKFPGELLHNTFLDPDNTGEVHARTELERRGEYIEILERRVGMEHPALVQLVKQCLHDDPAERPITDEVLTSLQIMKMEVDGEYGASMIKLDIARVRFAKDMKMKDKRIRELAQIKEQQQNEIERQQTGLEEMAQELEVTRERDRHNQEDIVTKNREIASKDSQIQHLQSEVEARDRQLQQLQSEAEGFERQLQQLHSEIDARDRQLQQLHSEIEARNRQLQQKKNEVEARERQLQQLRNETKARDEQITTTQKQMEDLHANLESKESRLREELQTKDAEISKLTEELKKWEEQEVAGKVPEFPLQLRWNRGPDMPFEMTGPIQSVVVQGTVYVGGGYTEHEEDGYRIMEYDTLLGEWTTLPPYRACLFAVTSINKQLVLVGGWKIDHESKVLGVWKSASKEWVHPYPDMPTARLNSSAVPYKEWLAVAGGKTEEGHELTSVEVMNVDSKQWYSARSMPVGWHGMKTATLRDVWYLMGGCMGKYYTSKVCRVSLPALISQLDLESSSKRQRQIWTELSKLNVHGSTPLSISGSLLALGGMKDKDVTSIQLYQPQTEKWLKVGDLPSPRCRSSSAMITERDILLVGGEEDWKKTRRTDIAFDYNYI